MTVRCGAAGTRGGRDAVLVNVLQPWVGVALRPCGLCECKCAVLSADSCKKCLSIGIGAERAGQLFDRSESKELAAFVHNRAFGSQHGLDTAAPAVDRRPRQAAAAAVEGGADRAAGRDPT